VVEVFGCSEQAFGEGAWRDAIAEEDLEGVIDHVRNEHAADRGRTSSIGSTTSRPARSAG
jgi:hypothetical protein